MKKILIKIDVNKHPNCENYELISILSRNNYNYLKL